MEIWECTHTYSILLKNVCEWTVIKLTYGPLCKGFGVRSAFECLVPLWLVCLSDLLLQKQRGREHVCSQPKAARLTCVLEDRLLLRSGIFTAHEYHGSNNKTTLAKSLWGLRKDLILSCLSFLISSSKVLFKGCVLDGLIPSLTCCPSQLVSCWLTLLQWLLGNHAAAAMGSGLSIATHFLLSELPVPAVQVSRCTPRASCLSFLSQRPGQAVGTFCSFHTQGSFMAGQPQRTFYSAGPFPSILCST